MADLYQQRYRIPSVRLQAWDYRSNAAYFVTICTKTMIRHFGHITDGAVMEYSLLGATAFQFWNEISKRNPNVFLDAFVIMPNHVHGIIIINTPQTNQSDGSTTSTLGETLTAGYVEPLHATALQTQPQQTQPQPQKNELMSQISPKQGSLSAIIRSYKSAVTKFAGEQGLDFAWQSRFYEHIIRNDDEFNRIRLYIQNNPAKWLLNDKDN